MGNIKIIRGVFDIKLEQEHASVIARYSSPSKFVGVSIQMLFEEKKITEM